jgi:hypothetical protein
LSDGSYHEQPADAGEVCADEGLHPGSRRPKTDEGALPGPFTLSTWLHLLPGLVGIGRTDVDIIILRHLGHPRTRRIFRCGL